MKFDDFLQEVEFDVPPPAKFPRYHIRPRSCGVLTDKKLRSSVLAREELLERCATQEWPGVDVREFCENQGRGVIATQPFQKGEVIIDYHGKKIKKEVGQEIMNSTDENDRRSDYVFFGPYGYCADASAEHCVCHPQTRTLGRLFNFAAKGTTQCNVYPRYFVAEKQEKIIFVAARDISLLKELRFDCGDKNCQNISN